MRTFSGFFETLGDLDWLAIVVATIVVLAVITMLFYGPGLGKKWAQANGTEYSMKMDLKQDIPGLVQAFLLQIGVAYMGAADDIEHSLVTALMVTLFLIGPALMARVIWLDASKTAYAIDLGYYFCAVAVGGYVQGLMA